MWQRHMCGPVGSLVVEILSVADHGSYLSWIGAHLKPSMPCRKLHSNLSIHRHYVQVGMLHGARHHLSMDVAPMLEYVHIRSELGANNSENKSPEFGVLLDQSVRHVR